MKRSVALLVILMWIGVVGVGCFTLGGEAPNDGGWNRGEQKAGNQEGGVKLWSGQIALHPGGEYFLSRGKPYLWVGTWESRKMHVVERLSYVERLVFDEAKPVIYLTRTDARLRNIYLTAYDLRAEKVLWESEISGRWDLNQMRLDFEPKTQSLVLTASSSVLVYDARDGKQRWKSSTWAARTGSQDETQACLNRLKAMTQEERKSLDFQAFLRSCMQHFGIRDVDLASHLGKLVVTVVENWKVKAQKPEKLEVRFAGQGEAGQVQLLEQKLQHTLRRDASLQVRWKDLESAPKSQVIFFDLKTGKESALDVPNCAGELVMAKDGEHAFLAPTTCNREDSAKGSDAERRVAGFDPVSVLNLRTQTWVRNLPGFGPVALSKDGKLAVAFMDRQQLDPGLFLRGYGELPPATGPRYMLMFIDTHTLRFTHMDIGEQLPRYYLMPDGQHLVLDTSEAHSKGTSELRILDLKTKQLQSVSGLQRLEHFVVPKHSAMLYTLEDGKVFGLNIDSGRLAPLSFDFEVSSLNVSPDGQTLLLRDKDNGKVHLFCIAQTSLCGSISTQQTPSSL